MSTQRRRVLENGGLIIPTDGVYIEGLDRKVYTVDEWKGGNDANSVAVASGDVKFRIALTEPSASMRISSTHTDPLENYMTAIWDVTAAKADYDGAGNTANILKVQPSTDYAAGYCDTFTFPDGKTKGYLPAFGQLWLVYQNKTTVDTALSKCGGTAMGTYNFYWSSTFAGASDTYRFCYILWLGGGSYDRYGLGYNFLVRPFADIS